MKKHRGRHQRRSLRLPHYDYSQSGAYFVTLRTYKRKLLFGDIIAGEVRLNNYGNIALLCWQAIPMHFPNAHLDEFVIMPNHVHGIVILESNRSRGAACCAPTKRPDAESNKLKSKPAPSSLSAVVRSFKSAVTKRINEVCETDAAPIWQRSYWDHVIRDDRDLNRIREYIINNPLKWHPDRNNPEQ